VTFSVRKRTFTLLGDLTINGITRAVKLQARANTVGSHPFYDNADAAGFQATTTLRRSDFGMGKYAPVVSDDLTVTITVEAVESNAYQAALEKQAAATKKTSQ
jgi:polyisoprenoid-binding protein YceI